MDLETAIREIGMSSNLAMDLLQNHGVISDLCVHLEDIPAGEETDRAIRWLTEAIDPRV